MVGDVAVGDFICGGEVVNFGIFETDWLIFGGELVLTVRVAVTISSSGDDSRDDKSVLAMPAGESRNAFFAEFERFKSLGNGRLVGDDFADVSSGRVSISSASIMSIIVIIGEVVVTVGLDMVMCEIVVRICSTSTTRKSRFNANLSST